MERLKNRTRIVPLTRDNCFETDNGTYYPIKAKPLIFGESYMNLLQIGEKVDELEKEMLKERKEISPEYYQALNEYMKEFFNTVMLITEFNGYETTEQEVQKDFSVDNIPEYIAAVQLGVDPKNPAELAKKKKKLRKQASKAPVGK